MSDHFVDANKTASFENTPETKRCSKDTIYRQAVVDALNAVCDRECEYSKQQRSVMCGACRLGSAFDAVDNLPSAEPEPSELARDIATIIENEMDMRVILRNADAEPCDFCVYNEDCEEMRLYCPARGREGRTDE